MSTSRFAELTAAIFLHKGIKVFLFQDVCPTPFIPYGILKHKFAAGVMVTASHNPKDDNGFKIYWENAVQIISPHDKGIQKCILECLKPEDSSWDTSKVHQAKFYSEQDILDLEESYFKDLKEDVLYPEINKSTKFKFTYTPMHGVGYNFMKKAFEIANFEPFVVVEEQKLPDPEFPTVKFPNPEEGKSALNLSMKVAGENGSTVIIANDPDADRMACAVKAEK